MESPLPHHLWIRGGSRRDRDLLVRSLDLPPLLVPQLSAHRQLRGPYTATGALVRALVPPALAQQPEAVRNHDVEILSVAPELSTVLPNSRATLTSMAIPAERTRFYARLRTQRISHGIVELLLTLNDTDAGPRALVVTEVEDADHTDLEFLATALRRIEPHRVTLVVCSGAEVPEPLAGALAVHAQRRHLLLVDGVAPVRHRSTDPAEDLARARRFVEADGVTDDPTLTDAYRRSTAEERAQLHDERAAHLVARQERSLELGAIPYHLSHGQDPHGAGVRALQAATEHCVCHGFYHATAELGQQGLELVDPQADPQLWWKLVGTVGLSLAILSRTKEAQRLYEEARLHSIDPKVHMTVAYMIAMLYTRHNELEDRDEHQAKGWLNSAIATASIIEDPSDRAFLSAFYRNGLALVEVNLGDPVEALRLVNECVDSLDRLLSPDEHRLHRTVLKNNRARVYAMLGQLDNALRDYAVVIAADPNHAEHYLERGNILRRLGRCQEAGEDYARAISLSPPFAEIYYNRGDLRLSCGDRGGAMADFSYVIELEPECVDAYINRAGLYLEDGDFEAARADALAGLRHDPANAYLHAAIGQADAETGDLAHAKGEFDLALKADPHLVVALAGRAALLWESGDPEGALQDLSEAIELAPDDAYLHYNRARLHQDRGRWIDALLDLDTAAALEPDDPDLLDARRVCQQAILDASGSTPAAIGSAA